MLRIIFIILLFSLLSHTQYGQSRRYQLPEQVTPDGYSKAYIVVKLKSKPTQKRGKSSELPLGRETDPFLPFLRSASRSGANHPLSTIRRVKLRPGEDPLEVINQMLQRDDVEYAEPYFNYRPLFIPDDPQAQPGANQWYLSTINAYEAWTIEKGDTSIVVGILDTGVATEHPDLVDNLFINYADPINGIDDDNDGLIDNYTGWDIANDDNNPIADSDLHGHGVTGVSSAATNNGLGIAGVGFRSKFMPIKIFLSGSNSFYRGYEAIVLAAELGCKVINLSWGSEGSFSQAGQDIIDYVVEEKDVVVVAAAGNTNAELDFYPASFRNVLSVGASNRNDIKADFATYSYHIDLIAPGKDIYVMNDDATFSMKQGTSYSSPMVAGAAALLRSRFPDLSAQQIMERLRVNADDIYELSGNQAYLGKLGRGRLNVHRALTNNVNSALRIDSLGYTNGVGRFAFYGDTLTITSKITNYLNPTSNAVATLSSGSDFVEILQGQFNVGSLGTMGSKTNEDNPFKVRLKENLPPDTALVFRVDYADGAYTDFEYFTINSSPEYLNVTNGSLTLTANSPGEFCYNEDLFSQGLGLTLNGVNLMDNMGLIIADGPDRVKDNVPNIISLNIRDHDFEALEPIKYYQNSIAPVDARSTYIDNPALSNPLDVRVEQKLLAWNDPAQSDFMILEYRITNTGASDLSSLHTGLFTDWNLNNKDLNEALWDSSNRLGYIRDVTSDTLYAGLALLHDTTSFYFAIDNKNANGNTRDIQNLLDDADKYQLVSNGFAKTSAGTFGGGNDVSQSIGYTISTLAPNESIKLAFVLVASSSLTNLQDAVAEATVAYQAYLNTPPLLHITQTCLGETAVIDPPQGTTYAFYDDAQLTNLLYEGSGFVTPPVNATQSYFVVNKDSTYTSDVYRVQAQPKLVQADFSFSQNPLLLDETGETGVRITDQSTDGVAWSWDLGNGFTSTVQNPLMNYANTGLYTVTLTVTSDLGCTEMISKALEVANRSNKPVLDDIILCKGESASLDPDNATLLNVYTDEALTNLIFSGTAFQTGSIDRDTLFFITSIDSTYESNPQPVTILTSKVKASFNYRSDTSSLSNKYLLHLTSISENEALYAWVINDMLQGVSTDIQYDYSGLDQIDIKLLAEDSNGCQDSVLTQLIPVISPLPYLNDSTICQGDSIFLKPANGSLFYFYNNPDLSTLVYKGSGFWLPSLSTDTTIYITSIDSLLESPPLPVNITVSDLAAKFSLTPDSLDIGDLNTLTLTESSTSAKTYQWTVNGATISEDPEPVLEFLTTGKFDIQLKVSDELGCESTLTQTLTITAITGLTSPIKSLGVYPNPATHYLTIRSQEMVSITLSDLKGSILYHQAGSQQALIDLSSLPSGLYILEVSNGDQTTFKKIIRP